MLPEVACRLDATSFAPSVQRLDRKAWSGSSMPEPPDHPVKYRNNPQGRNPFEIKGEPKFERRFQP
jgi:hypothetical protein